MHRLLRVRAVPAPTAWTPTSLWTCPKCNFYRGTTPLLLDSMMKNRRVSIRKQNTGHHSSLTNYPGITMDKLHKIDCKYIQKQNKSDNSSVNSISLETTIDDQNLSSHSTDFSEFSNTYSDNMVLEEDSEVLIEDLRASGIMDESMIIKSVSLINDSHDPHYTNSLESDLNKKSSHLEKSKNTIIEEQREARELLIYQEKLKQFNKSILSYVDACVNSNSTFQEDDLFKWKIASHKMIINDINVFNVYIGKLASTGNLASLFQVLIKVREMKINLNAQTYAYIFDCIGRVEQNDDLKLGLLKQISEEMINDHVSLNDIITKSVFVYDQRTVVDNMIKLLDKDFQPVYELPNMSYDCRLLNKLSEENATPSSTVEGLFSVDDLEARVKKQMKLEIDGQITVHNIAKENASSHFWTSKLTHLESKWEKQALHAFKRNLAILKREESFEKNRMPIHPFLSLSKLKPMDYVRIIMREVRKLGTGSEVYSLSYNSLCRNVGTQVFKMYEAKTKDSNGVNEKMYEVYMKYCDWFIKRDDKLNPREKWTLLEHEANKTGVTLNAEVPAWQSNIHWRIGNFLYKIILEDLKIDFNFIVKKKESHHHDQKMQQAFYIILRQNGIKKILEIKPIPTVSILYKESNPETLMFNTTLTPSVCPPRPWTSIHYGGYIVSQTNIIKTSHMGNQQWEKLVEAPPRKLYPALDSLNQLGSIPWTVNKSVLDVAITVFQNKGSVELKMPQPPSILPIPNMPKNASPEEKMKIKKERVEVYKKRREMYSLWCDALYRLSLANHFRDDVFWLPHNMDFRGRVYPIPPHLNHLGSDLARSLLVFALKKPLGPKGLDWLKLHCINLTGFKKRDPIRERLKFANENLDKILDSAENPLTGQRWWATSDEPWQTLSTCMEIAAAMKSPNPEEYMSGFPIHQDGSCNGLQHYAALGRDQIGAESVNLYPSDVPQDVYSVVVAMVNESRKKDAEDESSQYHEIAKNLDGFIRRKVLKQTVMTTVYGVTQYGAKEQIDHHLADVEDFPVEHIRSASSYLMMKTFENLKMMFKSARQIQDWLTDCANIICIVRRDNMEWVTPLGLPVIQTYSPKDKNQFSKNKSLNPTYTPDIFREPDVRKQKNAFAPNFVHSLDASHMMLTSIHCEHVGVTYVSVHDCYWTHPCNVEIMNKICREQFVALHSEPILEDFSNFLIEKFGYPDIVFNENDANIVMKDKKVNPVILKKKLNATLRKVPKQGDFDLNGVLSSTYFFS